MFGFEKCDAIYNKIKYLISQRDGISYTFSHNYAKFKFDSLGSLPLQETSALYNVIILIKSNNYYYNIFLDGKKNFGSIKILRFGGKKVAKEEF